MIQSSPDRHVTSNISGCFGHSQAEVVNLSVISEIISKWRCEGYIK